MNVNNDESFMYRSEGGHFDVGSEDGDNVSALIKVDNKLFCITRKNTRTIVMADDVDPERTNPNIKHNIQHILPHGSDSKFVGKTLQQANILFEKHSLPETVDHNKGVSIAFSFLNEITSLEKDRVEYFNEESGINSNIHDSSHIPSLPNLEQKVKKFISNADHTCGLIMSMAYLFYPSVKGKGWEEKLIEELKFAEQDDFINFIESFKEFTTGIRRMRNKIEHPHGQLTDDDFVIQNYKLTKENTVSVPSVCYISDNYNYPETRISVFMDSVVYNLLNIFETLMAYLCNANAQPFAGDKRIVIMIPEDKRKEHEKHVSFTYKILWTK